MADRNDHLSGDRAQATLTCKRCDEAKPMSEFYASNLASCKECHKAGVRARRLRDDKVRAYDRERAKLPHRKAKALKIKKEWRQANPDAERAQSAVSNAVRAGKLSRPDVCDVCSSFGKIHAHHRDYGKPLDVVWLCARCHHRLHALIPEFEGINKRSGPRAEITAACVSGKSELSKWMRGG